jgi:YidC/Oxa1 family membrane protein insertase
MDRNQIILIAAAVVLFVASLQLGGQQASPPAEPPRAVEAPSSSAPLTPAGPGEPPAQAPPAAAANAQPGPEPVAIELSTLSNGSLQVEITNQGARLRSAQLTQYRDRAGEGALPVELATDPERGVLATRFGEGLPGAEQGVYRIRERTERIWEGELRWPSGAQLIQRIELDPEGYGGTLSVLVQNQGQIALETDFELDLFARHSEGTPSALLQNKNLSVWSRESGYLTQETVDGLEKSSFFGGGGALRESLPPPVDWVALESQYFLAAALAEGTGFGAALASNGMGAGSVSLVYPERQIGPGQQLERRYRLYLGPKVDEAIAAVDARLDASLVVGYAWVRPITLLFARLLIWLHDYVIANYGIGIILITLLLRVAMYPLTQKSMQSMRRMSVLAPQLKEVQERYKSDPARQQQELMALYKRTGINPLAAMGSGCLPMLLQMPFMIALYFALQGMIELRQASFLLWIDDLSAPEELASVFGVPIRPLALAMGGSMFLQTYLQPGGSDPQQQQQRQMMLMMSVVFVVMFYGFPSGLVLYWLVSNLLGIAQQALVNRAVPLPAAPGRQQEVSQ